MTVPFVLLRHMEISGLDVDKWFTIRNVYYGRAHKIFMQFSRRWWKEDYAIDHGVTVTDLAIRNVVYTPAGQDPSIDKGVIIASYAWEQDSHGLPHARRGPADRAGARGPREDPSARPPTTFEFGISHDWALDRHGGGIGPLFRPFEMSGRFFDDIARPVGRVWFADDACSRAGAALDRGRDRVGRPERRRDQRRDAQRAAGGLRVRRPADDAAP